MAKSDRSQYGKTWSKSAPLGMNKSGMFLGGPSGSGNAKEKPQSYANVSGHVLGRAKNSGASVTGPTGSGSPTDKWVGSGVNRHYASVPEANKDRGKVSTPTSYIGGKRDEAAKGVNAGTSRQVERAESSSSSGGTAKTGVGGTTASASVSPNAASNKKPQKNPKPKVTSSGKASPTSSGAAPEKKVPAVPGSLNYFMKKAAASGDKNVRNRAYQMWKNSKKSPGFVTPAGMNVDKKDLPANPKKGDAIKGKAGVTWTWNGSRWTRGKASE